MFKPLQLSAILAIVSLAACVGYPPQQDPAWSYGYGGAAYNVSPY